MGEIAEEGDKLDEEQKKESGKNENVNGSREKKETLDANLIKEVQLKFKSLSTLLLYRQYFKQVRNHQYNALLTLSISVFC